MNDLSHGYDTSVGYSFGFYREMAPDWLDLCVRSAGSEPARRGAAFRYLELGCGQGFGLCLLAAANREAEFVGIDFQADHIAHAQGLAEKAGLTNVRFVEADFAELARGWPGDFGTFDYVTLHGILSWVSPQLRDSVIDCLGHATHAGSLVYVSYNAQPSWLGSMPFQHMASLLKKVTGKPSDVAIRDSIALFERLRTGNAAGFRALPALDARLQTLRSRSVNYLVHEYMNESWQLFWHSEAARELGRAGLRFAGSATIADNLLPDIFPQPLRAPIMEQASAELRQDLQDFALNQGFRRDIFSSGELPPLPREFRDSDTKIYLLAAPDGGQMTVPSAFGQVAIETDALKAIVDALKDGPVALRALAGLVPSSTDFRQLLLLLFQADTIAVAAAGQSDTKAAERLNRVIAAAACDGAAYEHLAAARLGSAIRVSRMELMLLDSWAEAQSDNGAIADGVRERMSRRGQKLYHHGRVVDDAVAADRLRTVAGRFIEDIVPRWRELGVVE